MLTNKKRAIQKTSNIKPAPAGHHVTPEMRKAHAVSIANRDDARYMHAEDCTCGNHKRRSA